MGGQRSTGEAALVASLLVPLAAGIVYLLIQVLGVAFVNGGAPTLRTSTWLIMVLVYAVRRLPYAVRGAHAALQHLSPALEEAALGFGASRPRAVRRIALPLTTPGLLVVGLLAFITSAVDFSSTILLVPRVELGPLSYGVYLSMQSTVGRGPGAALSVVAIVLMAVGTRAASGLARRAGAAGVRP